MATYTKETALYDTGAIANDIASAGETATDYITYVSAADGIKVHNANDTSNYAQINSDGMQVVKSGVSVAEFGETSRVGKESDGFSRTELTAGGMQIYRKDGNTDTLLANIGYGVAYTGGSSTANSPYFTFGTRNATGGIGALSVSEGTNNIARGSNSHAEGRNTTVTGLDSHVEGYNTSVSATMSHAEGYSTTIVGLVNGNNGSHVEGENSRIYYAEAAHAEGYVCRIGKSDDTYSTSDDKIGSHVEGNICKVLQGNGAHAEGSNTTVTSGIGAHAEGSHTTVTSGEGAHAEGYYTTVTSGYGAHAEGSYTTASGIASHAEGSHTTANKTAQVALGTYNVADTTPSTAVHPSGTGYGNYAVIVGNGTSDSNRSNALTVAWNGSVVASGDITDGNGNVLSNKIDASDVPAWAKASTKPTYSATEIVGLLNYFHPVGSYFETRDANFNPNTAWGGTWELEIEGQVHVSAGTNYAISGALTNTSDGGEAEVTLTANQSGQRALTIDGGAHTHSFYYGGMGSGSRNSLTVYNAGSTGNYGGGGTHTHTVAASNATEAHNNMQPYINVYRWLRTA